MRIDIVITVLFVLAARSFSQGFYPLHVGNVWQYYDEPMHPYILTETITGDTVLSNGKTYAVYSGHMFPSKFLRQNGSKVFACDNADSTEYTLLDFAANPNDTIAVLFPGPYTIVLLQKSFNSYLQQFEWVFGNGFAVSKGSWRIVDSLGIFAATDEPGVSWTLQGAQINGVLRYGSIAGLRQEESRSPTRTVLFQNYPNPFNPSTTINFSLSASSDVSLRIIDLLGRDVAMLCEERLESGEHSYIWNASRYSDGVYLCRINAGSYTESRKLIFLK
jgi:Secretion system C-terminal sorting domain